MSVNKCIILGRCGKDPEIKQFDSENSKASFSVATSERGYKAKNGTDVPEKTEWHNIVCWKGLATIAERYIRKGTQIYLEGKITTRSWEKDGTKHYITEIVADKIELLGGKEKEKDPFEEPPMGEPVYKNRDWEKGINAEADPDLPF